MKPRRRWLLRGLAVLAAAAALLGVVAANCESIPPVRERLDNFRGGFVMPPHAEIHRGLSLGTHPYLAVLPGAARSPAMRRIQPDPAQRAAFLEGARVRIAMTPDYAHIDDKAGVIVVSWWYYHLGANLDLYLDLLHELTHIRQHQQGMDLWDANYRYSQRPTEIEGYAVAVEEGRRLGMSEERLREHLHNPWMTADDVVRLRADIDALLARVPLGPE